jgi:hypothetical protein
MRESDEDTAAKYGVECRLLEDLIDLIDFFHKRAVFTRYVGTILPAERFSRQCHLVLENQFRIWQFQFPMAHLPRIVPAARVNM